MKSRARPALRPCPICRVAMQASKSREDLADFDLFECQTCHTTIRQSAPRPRNQQSGN